MYSFSFAAIIVEQIKPFLSQPLVSLIYTSLAFTIIVFEYPHKTKPKTNKQTKKQTNKTNQTNKNNLVLDCLPVSFLIVRFVSVTCLTPVSYFDPLPWTKERAEFQLNYTTRYTWTIITATS